MKPWKEGQRWEENGITYIQSDEDGLCPFCNSKDIYSGSWTPACCRDCGAMWYLRVWRKGEGML